MSIEGFDLSYFESKIQHVLDKEFVGSEPKKQIKHFPNRTNVSRLNFACPVCGDSEKSAYKKRGNLYTKNLMFKCFNCDTYISFTKFCDNFNINIDMEDKIKLYEYLDANVTYAKSDDYLIESLDRLIDIEDWVEKSNTSKESNLIDIKPIQKGSKAHQYLVNRYIHDYSNIYQGIYRKQKNGKTYWSTNVIIILNRSADKLVGYQIRNLENSKDNRFYKIVEFDEIYNFVHEEPIDETEAVMYNKLSHFYNILNVNFEDVVTIFEGYLDTIFFPNSIGLVGANSTNDILNFLLNAEDLKIRFFFDNDEKGHKKSKELLNKEYSVFLWNRLFERLIAGSKDVKVAQNFYKNTSDLNDLVVFSKNTKIHIKLKLDNFFSEDKNDNYVFDENYISFRGGKDELMENQKFIDDF